MRRKLCTFGVAVLAAPLAADPRFEPVPIPTHVYDGGWKHFVGGGLAAFDCNADGLPELFAAGGANTSILLGNTSTPGGRVQFDDITPTALRQTEVIGAYPLDIDSDGFMDIAVLRVGENVLLRGAQNCAFEPFSGLGFQSSDRWTTAFSATWETGQALPMLAFGNYVDRSDPAGPFQACDSHDLYRPSGNIYGAPYALTPGYCTLSMLFSDWGRSGQADLRISNDRHYYVTGGQEQLWSMTMPPHLYGPADGWQDHRLWGMGIASRDLDHDGRTEVYLSSMGDQRLQRRLPGDSPHFQDVPFDMGTTAHRPYLGDDGRPSTGWHIAFGDVQNDGYDDVLITKGNVEQMPDSAMEDPNNLLVQGANGQFTEAGDTAGVASLHRGRGAALVDLNADGLLDIAVVNRRAPMEVWQNVTQTDGDWISIRLGQTAPNLDAIGAWIEVERDGVVRVREITVGGGHAGGSAVPEHFGLGDAEKVNLRVIWPDGAVSEWKTVETDQHLMLTRQDEGFKITPY